MKLKLGQVFWMRDVNEYGGLGRSDYECKVVGTKICNFIDGTRFTDYLIEKTRLNSYHASFNTKKSRTTKETLRYDHDSKEIKYWFEINWPAHCAEWRLVKDKIYRTKPKGLRKGP